MFSYHFNKIIVGISPISINGKILKLCNETQATTWTIETIWENLKRNSGHNSPDRYVSEVSRLLGSIAELYNAVLKHLWQGIAKHSHVAWMVCFLQYFNCVGFSADFPLFIHYAGQLRANISSNLQAKWVLIFAHLLINTLAMTTKNFKDLAVLWYLQGNSSVYLKYPPILFPAGKEQSEWHIFTNGVLLNINILLFFFTILSLTTHKWTDTEDISLWRECTESKPYCPKGKFIS